MKKNSIIDYLSCILFKAAGPLIRSLPRGFTLFLGRRIGDLLYYFDCKHKAIAYSNIKTAFGEELLPSQISRLTRRFYQTFGQDIIEMFLIPLVDKNYFKKYISLEGLDHIHEGFRRGKGVILVAVHAGSWELSNIICANLGFPFVLFVKEQGFPRLNALLNACRIQKGCRIIQKENQARALIDTLKKNESIGITIDQGGDSGVLVKFFGKNTSMATGAIKLALKYDAAIVPAFYAREKGPYIKIIIEPVFELKRSQNIQDDIRENLQSLTEIFQKYIRKYPQEYLWTYKIWKYSDERRILILHDGKAGHLRQSEAVANIINKYLKEKDIKTQVSFLEVKFDSSFNKAAMAISTCMSGKYLCQGCLWCLKKFLKKESYDYLIGLKPDIVISCGSSLAPVNYVVSRENLAKSIAILRPSILNTRRFDLVIMPKHDNPLRRKNIVTIEGALNLIDEEYLKEESEKLIQSSVVRYPGRQEPSDFNIGVLIGGDTKKFFLNKNLMLVVIGEIKKAAEKLNANILLTTSRRTSSEIENLIKEEFKNYPRCKLLVIANEKNIPEAVGGILGLSEIIISSPESISMISEAVNSRKYALLFEAGRMGVRHQRFLHNLMKHKYIYLVKPPLLSSRIIEIWRARPPIHILSDNVAVREAIRRIL